MMESISGGIRQHQLTSQIININGTQHIITSSKPLPDLKRLHTHHVEVSTNYCCNISAQFLCSAVYPVPVPVPVLSLTGYLVLNLAGDWLNLYRYWYPGISVSDPHGLYAVLDPDPALKLNADPDPVPDPGNVLEN
jgi:hypothetical protein